MSLRIAGLRPKLSSILARSYPSSFRSPGSTLITPAKTRRLFPRMTTERITKDTSMATLPLLSAAGPTVSTKAVPWYFAITAPPMAAKVIGALPPLFFLGLQLSPLKTMKEIKERQDVGEMTPLPHFALFTNCVIWTAYGLLNADATVTIANGMGVVAAGFYALVFTKYAKDPMTKYFVGSGAALCVPAACLLALEPAQASTALGLMGNAAAMFFFASPLAVIKTVLRTKSTEAMPFLPSLATLGNCVAWATYGLTVAHDELVVFPNIIGIGLACAQLSLFARFGIHKPKV